jgi:hypothetical protein
MQSEASPFKKVPGAPGRNFAGFFRTYDEHTLVSDVVLFLAWASWVCLCDFLGGFKRTGKFRGSHQDAQVLDVRGVGVSPHCLSQ